ncbi:MAG: 50S ribosomal protein L23 [Spirochaetales bacterium]|nr:50S ribosomal protein L23 [Spirochaetales bacterium]
MTASQIIIEPVVTEKSNHLKEKKKYVFRVDMRANKFQITQALRELFNVHCLECRVLIVKSKPKRVRYKKGYTATWKKAIVTLPQNETISVFEGA